MRKEEKQQITRRLKAQKKAIRPSPRLLHAILSQLPLEEERRSFPWIQFAIPAGVALLVGGVFFAVQYFHSSTPVFEPAQVTTLQKESQQSLNLASLQAEERQIEQELTYEAFFQDALSLQEIDTALANF